jgi:hypothetical protein
MQIDFKLKSNQLYFNNGETQNFSYFDDDGGRKTSCSLTSEKSAQQSMGSAPTLHTSSSAYVKTSGWLEKKSNSSSSSRRSWKRRYCVVANGLI